MELDQIVQRINVRIRELGLSARKLSLMATGSPDTVRNWQRAVDDGVPASATIEKIRAVAKALQVSPEWLLHGADQPPRAVSEPRGFQEPASIFVFQEQFIPADQERLTLRAVFGDRARRPASFRINTMMPGFGLWPGDVVVVDTTTSPRDGDLAVVTLPDGTTTVRRLLTPWLLTGDADKDSTPQRRDAPGVRITFPVIGSIRGIV